MARNDDPQTRAVRLATDDVSKVIKGFADGPKFMGKSPAEERRAELMANAASDIQALQGTLSKGLLETLARLDND